MMKTIQIKNGETQRERVDHSFDPGQLGEPSAKLGQLFILSCNLKLQYVLYPSPKLNKLDFFSVVLN